MKHCKVSVFHRLLPPWGAITVGLAYILCIWKCLDLSTLFQSCKPHRHIICHWFCSSFKLTLDYTPYPEPLLTSPLLSQYGQCVTFIQTTMSVKREDCICRYPGYGNTFYHSYNQNRHQILKNRLVESRGREGQYVTWGLLCLLWIRVNNSNDIFFYKFPMESKKVSMLAISEIL